jgi:LuxR family transcriptional regulator, maltose regulon positive regulatory protein
VPAGRDERDPQRFWVSEADALRQTSAGSGLVRELTAAPDLDGWVVAERPLKDLVVRNATSGPPPRAAVARRSE